MNNIITVVQQNGYIPASKFYNPIWHKVYLTTLLKHYIICLVLYNSGGGVVKMARQRKILISLPDSLLDEADNMAYSQNINRSEFIREAMRLYIRERKKTEIVQKLKKGYEEMAEFNLEYSDFCLETDNRQLQLYEDKLAECE